MGYIIKDTLDSITIYDGLDNNWIISKADMNVYHYGDKIRLMTSSYKMDISYTMVDAPLVNSGQELYNIIKGYKIDNPNTSNNSILEDSKVNSKSIEITLKNIYEEIQRTNNLLKLILS